MIATLFEIYYDISNSGLETQNRSRREADTNQSNAQRETKTDQSHHQCDLNMRETREHR